MTRIVDWYHNKEKKQWVNMEEEIVGPQLKVLPWTESHLRPKRNELTLFVKATLKVWDDVVKGGKLSTLIGPMTPLFLNPEFPPTRGAQNIQDWYKFLRMGKYPRCGNWDWKTKTNGYSINN